MCLRPTAPRRPLKRRLPTTTAQPGPPEALRGAARGERRRRAARGSHASIEGRRSTDRTCPEWRSNKTTTATRKAIQQRTNTDYVRSSEDQQLQNKYWRGRRRSPRGGRPKLKKAGVVGHYLPSF